MHHQQNHQDNSTPDGFVDGALIQEMNAENYVLLI
jgi:hypothetical protein